MKPVPTEEKLSKEWNLRSEKDISEKIFEDYSEGDKLADLLDGEKLVACSYALGRMLAGADIGLKASQLRRFYDALLSVRATVNRAKARNEGAGVFGVKAVFGVHRLKPQLANAAARQPTQVKPFFEVVNPMLDVVQDADDYERLCDFVEAVVAYHKYCGGRD